jgi:hypothetical protein
MMPTKTSALRGRDVFVPIEGFAADIDGTPVNFKGGQTRVSAAWLEEHSELAHLFEPIRVHYDVEQATNAPGERRGE